MYKKRLHSGLALLLIIMLLGSVLIVAILKTGKPARAVPPDDWTTYQYTPGRSGFNSAETAINPNTASSLIHQWTISEGSMIATQPIVSNGKIYWGSWDGIEHATNSNGSQAWTANLGTVTSSTCLTTQGIVSAATVATVTINGTPTPVLFVGGGDTQFYALNANTGAVIWHTPIGVAPNNVIWSSPVLYNGSIYISTSSLCDHPWMPSQELFRTPLLMYRMGVLGPACGAQSPLIQATGPCILLRVMGSLVRSQRRWRMLSYNSMRRISRL